LQQIGRLDGYLFGLRFLADLAVYWYGENPDAWVLQQAHGDAKSNQNCGVAQAG
jgi:hypothetical protein